MSIRQNELFKPFLEGMPIGVCMLAVGMFGLVLSLSNNINKSKVISFLTFGSKASFCIYLIHIFFIKILYLLGITANSFPCIISIPIMATLNVLVCTVVYIILSKIPIVQKWLI